LGLWVSVSLIFAVLIAPSADGKQGDISIFREATAGETVSTSVFTHDFDTTVRVATASHNLSGGSSIQCEAGYHLVLYSARFDDPGDNGNQRAEIQTWLNLAGANQRIGWSQCYIRRQNGDMEGITAGGGIIYVAADNDALLLRSQRTCQGDDGIVREPDASSIQLIKLDDTWDYCRLSRTSNQTGPGTAFSNVTYNSQEELDTGSFAHTSGSADIALKTAGHYLILANTHIRSTANRRCGFVQRLTLDGTQVPGSRSTVYLRGNANSDSCYDGAMTVAMIVETTGANQILNVECLKEDSGTTCSMLANRTAITIAKLPDTGNYIRLDDSGTDNFNPNSVTALGWDTELEADACFDHNDNQIGVVEGDNYLFFCAVYDDEDNGQRVKWWQRWRKNGTSIYPYGTTGRYSRDRTDGGGGSQKSGNRSGLVTELLYNDYVETVSERLGNGGTMTADVKGVQSVQLSSILWPAGWPQVRNYGPGATNVQVSTAYLNGELESTGGSATALWVYFGTNDGGEVSGNWDSNAYFGANMSVDTYSTNVTGLDSGVTYYYRFAASNATTNVWASYVKSFTTLAPPVVTNGAGADTRVAGVTMNGELTLGGTADVTIYWGRGDGDTNHTAWANTNAFGTLAEGTFATGQHWAATLSDVNITNISQALTGGVSRANDAWTVTGSGNDIYGTADSFHFAYTQLTGDFDLYCRAGDLTGGTHSWRKGGIMAREALTNDSMNAFILRSPVGGQNRISFQHRVTNGAASASVNANGFTDSHYWLRLVRSGDVFSGYWASDVGGTPGSWSQMGTNITVDMSAQVYVGLAVTAHNAAELTSCTFDKLGGLKSSEDELLYGVEHYYRTYATNTYGEDWADASVAFHTEPPIGVGIVNDAASNIAETSATFNGTLNGTGSVFDVLVYWGTSDGGTDPGSWGNTNVIGSYTNVGPTALTYNASLASGVEYFYAFCATNGATNMWATPSESIETVSAPTIDNSAGAVAGMATATLRGELTDGGLGDITVYWGTFDGGIIHGNWENTNSLGELLEGTFETVATDDLLYGVTYTYRCYVTNSADDDWSGPQTFDPLAPTRGYVEAGTVVATDTWTTVSLDYRFVDPVVACVVNYATNSFPVVARVRNVGPTSFDVKLQNPGDLSNVVADAVHYVVMEEGTNQLPDGRKIEAQRVLSDETNENDNWTANRQEKITFGHTFTTPVVLGQVMTHNDARWSAFWSNDGGGSGGSGNPANSTDCYVGKHVASDNDIVRTNETLGIVVVEAGTGSIDGVPYEAGLGAVSIQGVDDSPPYPYTLSAFSSTPEVGVVCQTAMKGADGSWVCLYGASPLTPASVSMASDEDQILDEERSHAPEPAFYWIFGTALGYGQDLYVTNQPPSAISSNSAVFHADLYGAESIFDLYVYWGTSDGGTNAGSWANTNFVGTYTNVAPANISYTNTSLLGSTDYHYTFFASNQHQTMWADPSMSFSTLDNPNISNGSGADVAVGGATLNGDLIAAGSAEVTVYWGTSDGGTTHSAWQNTNSMGTLINGTFSTNETGLLYGIRYYYRCYATNALGEDWANSTETFLTTRYVPPATPGADFMTDASEDTDGDNRWEDVVLGNPSGLDFELDDSPAVTRVTGVSSYQGISAAYDFPGGSTGQEAGALLSDSGTSTYRSFQDPPGPLESGDWTVQDVTMEMWFKPDTLTHGPSNGQILFEDGGGTGYGIFINDNLLQLRKHPGSGLVSFDVSSITNEFIQAVGTYDVSAGAMALYVNGDSKGTASPGGGDWSGGDDAAVGTRGENNVGSLGNGQQNTESFDGKIAIFRVYRNQILTAGQISTNYQNIVGLTLGIANDPATAVTTNSATFNGTLTGSQGVMFDVYVYWGTSDGGTNVGSWGNTNFIGSYTNTPSQSVSYSASSLPAGTEHFYAFRASNAGETNWAEPSESVTTLEEPEVSNGTGADVAQGQATLNGDLIAGTTADVTVYWGTSDGGTSHGAWENTNSMGTVAETTFATNTSSDLLYGVQYYYRCYATNSAGDDWADSTASFLTVRPENDPVAGAYFEWDAARDVGGNAAWTSTTANAFTWTMASAQTPGDVSDARFRLLTKSYAFNAARATANDFHQGVPGDASNEDATFEFVLDTDGDNGVILESGGSGTGSQFDMHNGKLRAHVRPNATPITVEADLDSTDSNRFIHVVGVIDLGGQLTLYVDGTARDNASLGGVGDWSGTDNAGLGRVNGTSGSSGATSGQETGDFSGQIALMRFYRNTVFDAGDVTTNFEALYAATEIVNQPATSVSTNTATFNGTLRSRDAVYDVYVYWGTGDGGTNAASWGNTNFVGSYTNVVSTNVSYDATSLASGTEYFYTFMASNASEIIWAEPSESLETLEPPEVSNGTGADVAIGSATLNGELIAGTTADVTVYWGTSDGGTTHEAWEHTNTTVGSTAETTFSVGTTGELLYGVTYYYRCYATNSAGEDWANSTVSFTTKSPADVDTVYQQDSGTDGIVSLEAEHFTHNESPRSSHSWTLRTDGSASGGEAMEVTPNNQTSNEPYEPNHPRLDFRVNFVKTGTHYIWTRGMAPNVPASGNNDSVHSGLDTNIIATADRITGFNASYGWSKSTMDAPDASFDVTPTGDHVVNYWMREDGFVFDKFVLTTSGSYTPTGNGPAESPVVPGPPIGITNLAVSGVSTNAATFNGTLYATGSVFDVTVYWGTSDGGTNAGSWGNTNYVGTYTNAYSTNVSFSVNSLATGTEYFYAFSASNVSETTWGEPSTSFFTVGAPIASNSPATDVAATSATLNGLLAGNTYSADATIYWGLTDGGTTPSAWSNVSALGTVLRGAFSTGETVRAGGEYYFRCYATNAVGDDWADSSAIFTTLQASASIADVVVTEGDAGTVDAVFAVTMSDPCASNVTIQYVASNGTATAGDDFVAASGTLLVPAGVTSTQITVTVNGDTVFEHPDETFTLNLYNASNCTISDASATCTITDDDADVYLADWQYRMEVTFSGYGGASTLQNWPALVRLDELDIPGFDYDTFASDYGYDLRVGNGDRTRVLNFEIDRWDTNGESCVWVQVPELPAGGTNAWLYWGNPSDASLPSYATDGSTWASGHEGVWHMGETNALDSTPNSRNGTASGAPVAQSGYIGDAVNFTEASADFITIPGYSGVLGSAPRTLSAWIKTTDNDSIIMSWGTDAGSEKWIFRTQSANGTNGAIRIEVNGGYNVGTTAVTNDQWHYVVATFADDGSPNVQDVKLFVDGAQEVSSASLSYAVNTSVGEDVRIGRGHQAHDFNGPIDEARICSVARSADWILASYSNQVVGSAFNTFGTVSGQPLLDIGAGVTSRGINDADVTADLVSTGTAQTAVWLFWGTNDGGQVEAAWSSTQAFGTVSQPLPYTYTTNLNGLTDSTQYYYTYMASNTYGKSWAGTNFYTFGRPAIDNSAGATPYIDYAALNGNVVSTGGFATTVYTYWGTSDEGTSKSAWDHVITNGVLPEGAFSSNTVDDTYYGVTYYYRCYATNDNGDGWAPSSSSFQTLRPRGLMGLDVAIYRAATAGENITTATFTHDFDTTVREDARSYNLSGGTDVECAAGHYLVLYSSRFDDPGDDGNQRSEIQSWLQLDGSDQSVGWSQGYIRRQNGDFECVTAGGGIINVATDGDALRLLSARTDAEADGIIRENGATGIQLVKLDDLWDYCRLSRSSDTAGPGQSYADVTYDTQDELDTDSFAHTAGSGDVTLKTAGHYLVLANSYFVNNHSSRRTGLDQRLTLDGTQVDGSLTTVFLRANPDSDSCHDGAATAAMIIETTNANQVLNIECSREDVTATVDIIGGKTALTIAKLPDTGDYIRLDDNGTDNFNPATTAELGWNLEDEIDSCYTHTDSRIGVTIDDDYLFFCTLYEDDGIARAKWWQRWRKNGGTIYPYGTTGRYCRDASDGSGTNRKSGNRSGIVVDLVNGDYVETVSEQLGNTGTMAADVKGVQGMRLNSVSPLLPAIENLDASAIASTGATFNATLYATGAVYDVTVYWGETDGGVSEGGWDHTNSVGTYTNSTGAISYTVADGMTPTTYYYYTFKAWNDQETWWADPSTQFRTYGPPVIDNDGGAIVDVGYATLRGTLTYTGGVSTTVYTYYGDNDGGTTHGAWDLIITNGMMGEGSFSASTPTNLLYGLTYYYRCFATNMYGGAWADATTNFTTLVPEVEDLPVTENLVMWLKADDGVTHASGPVSAWADQSATGNDLSTRNGSPTYVGGQINGKPVVRLDGNDDMIRNSLIDFPTSEWSIFFVQKVQTVQNSMLFLMNGTTPGRVSTHVPYGNGTVFWDCGYNAAGSRLQVGGLTATNFSIWHYVSTDGGGSERQEIWQDGDLKANDANAVTISGASGSLFQLGSSNGSIYHDGDLAEFLVYKADLAAADRTDIGGYLAWKYGITSSYPAFTPPDPVMAITNSSVTNLAMNTATLRGTLRGSNTVFDLYVYYGTNDGGTAAAAWETNVYVGTYTNADYLPVSKDVTGLVADTEHFYTFMATNVSTNIWASPSESFQTMGSLIASNRTPAAITADSATLNGNLSWGGRGDVTIYWGPSDGGTDKGAWAHQVDFGELLAPSDVTTNLTGLLANEQYFYRCYATNDYTHDWADATTNFTTLPPSVSLGLSGSPITETSGQILLTATLGVESVSNVTVRLAFGAQPGDAVKDSDYTVSSTNIVVPAGNMSWNETVNGLDDAAQESNETIRVSIDSLVNGTNGSPTSVTGTITSDDPEVTNGTGPSGVGDDTATLSGLLTAGQSATVRFYYGTADGVMNAAAWDTNCYPNNVLLHKGYHDHNDDAYLNLDGNGGLMAETPYATVTLTTGPGNRGLDFNNDGDFQGSGAITNADYYENLFIGYFNAPETGSYEFRNAGDDDRAGIWLDLDQDDVFESSVAGLGSDRGEQLSWEDTNAKTVSLTGGQSYMIAFTHREGTAGSRADFRFKTPSMSAEAIVKPADAAQSGLWGTREMPEGIAFSSALTGLLANETYYYRAYATNDSLLAEDWADTAESFTTLSPALSIGDITVIEGQSGTTEAAFPITLTAGSAASVSVNFTTVNGTATAGSDYTATNGTFVIPAGVASTQLVVTVIADREDEVPSEDFSLELSVPVNCTIADSSAVCTITDDETRMHLEDWTYRMPISFDGYAGSETLTDWPALVRLDTGITGFDYADCSGGDGTDLRFVSEDFLQLLDYEVDTWDTNDESTVWVRIPELPPGGTNIWMYWGNDDLLTEAIAAPTDVSDCVLWLRADLGVQTSGTNVTGWLDQSGNGHDLAQTNATDQPVLENNVVGGKPVVRFSADSQYLRRTNALGITGNAAVTVFMVVESDGVNRRALQFGEANGTAQQCIAFTTDSSIRYNNGNSEHLYDKMYNGFGIGTWMVPAGGTYSDGRFFKNGDEKYQTGSGGSGNAKNLLDGETLIGQGRNAGSWNDRFLGDIAEIIVYERELSSEERNSVGHYLEEKYGLATRYTMPAAYADDGAVWSADHEAVFHMNETSALDATENTRNAYASGTPATAVGQIGDTVNFTKANGDFLTVTGYKGRVGTAARTMSAWIKTTENDASIMSWGANNPGQKWNYRVQTSNGSNGAIRVEVNGGANVGMTDLRDDQWHYVVGTFADDGSPTVQDILFYVDGVADGSSYGGSTTINTASGNDVRIAQDFADRYFNGPIDEARISSVVRSADWIMASYSNQCTGSSFTTFGERFALASPEIEIVLGAQNIGPFDADLTATLLSTGDAPTTVWAYWDTTNHGTNDPALWGNTNAFGLVTNLPPVALSTNISGLPQSTVHWYAYRASNSYAESWDVTSFETLEGPEVNNGTGATARVGSATLSGELTAGTSADIYIYWGREDGGTTKGNWQYVESLGAYAETSFTSDVTAYYGETYYYRCYASNAAGSAWATSTTNFATLTSGSPGDIAIYREAGGADGIAQGATMTHDWDTTVRAAASSYTLSSGTDVQCKAGHHLVLYSSRFDDPTQSNGERSELNSWLTLAGAALPIGRSQGYIRRQHGTEFECVTAGGGIIVVENDGDVVRLLSQRTDNQNDDVQREPGWSAIQLMRLDSAWDYCRLSRMSNVAGPGSAGTFVDVTYDTQDELDSGSFGHTGGSGDITLKTAGHYLVLANTHFVGTHNGRRNGWVQRLTLDGAQVDGSRTTVLIRGNPNSDNCYDGAASAAMIIETTGDNQVLNVECMKEDGAAGANIIGGKTAVTIARLPDSADYIRLDDSGTQDFNPASLTALTWDTELERDAGSFTHSGSQIGVTVDDDYLFFCALYEDDDAATRPKWWQRWRKNGSAIYNYGHTARYSRNANDSSGTNHKSGNRSAIIVDLLNGDYVETVCSRLAQGGVMSADVKGVQGMRIGSAFAQAVENAAATDVGTTNATLNGTISIPGKVFDVYVYYGTNDGLAVVGNWDASALLGEYANVSGQAVDYDATGLTQDTTYYYRFVLSNDVGTAWASPSASFSTMGSIVISNRTATSIAQTSATIRGELVSGGSGDTYVYWGPTDGGMVPTSWSYDISYGVLSSLPTQLESNVTGLLANETYHYRYYATNAVSAEWAPSTMTFTTAVASVSIAGTSVTEGNSGTVNAAFTVTLSHTSATDVAVNYDVDDYTATAGSDYVDVSDTLTIPAGQLSGQFTVAVIGDLVTESSEAFTVTLSSPSNCTIATATATGTIVDDDIGTELKNWRYKMKITFNGYTGSTTLSNFPALVVFNDSLPNFGYDQFVSPDGWDLRFTDASESQYLSYEIEDWNTSGDSHVWVKVPELSGTDTYIWAYWGNQDLLENDVDSPDQVPGCVLWLDASDIDGQGDGSLGDPANGGAVATWVDKSGKSHDVAQSTGADRPTRIESVVGGRPVVRFSANNHYLTRSDALGFSGNSAMTVFMVIEADDGVGRRAVHLGNASGASQQTIAFSTDSSFRYNNGNRIFAGDPMSGAFGIGTWMTEIGGTYGSGRFFKNGDEKSQTGSTNPANIKNLVDGELLIGQGRSNAGAWSDRFLGDIAEIVIYDRALSSDELNKVGYYLEQKYGLTTTYAPEASEFVSPPSYALDGSTWSEGFEAVYHLSEVGGTRYDSTLNNHNGTPMNGATSAVGRVDGCAEFFRPGSDTDNGDYIDLPRNFGLFDGSQQFSVSMWLKPTSLPTSSGSSRDPIALAMFGERNFFMPLGDGSPTDQHMGSRVYQSGGWNSPCSIGPLSVGTWYHVATTFTTSGAGNWKMYRDGGTEINTGSRTGTISSRSEENGIGGATAGDRRWFDGSIDEVRISRVVRSPDWVQATYGNMSNNGAFNAYGTTQAGPPTLFILR